MTEERPENSPLGDAIADAARRAGLGSVKDGRPFDGRALLTTMGGIRGIVEAVLPGLLFVLVFTVGAGLPVALGVSVGVAVIFTIVRLATRTPVAQALGGLVGVVASAALSLWTGRGQDNYLLGLWLNAGYGAAFLVSILVRWPLIGVAVGLLLGDGTAWRTDKRKFRVLTVLSLCWAALFILRLAIQLPLYLAGDVVLLGTFKLVLGIPLYAPLLVLTVLTVRSLYAGASAPDAGAAEDTTESR
ncbi:DUF3159 domain-containing protein [Microbacteriaceae bacterium VKM Ac-2855]|nr:DUF3159 domain-containing protein [Microbacteriaceae bacterium VKM Ac-2855]